jgi:hypothetical protein
MKYEVKQQSGYDEANIYWGGGNWENWETVYRIQTLKECLKSYANKFQP